MILEDGSGRQNVFFLGLRPIGCGLAFVLAATSSALAASPHDLAPATVTVSQIREKLDSYVAGLESFRVTRVSRPLDVPVPYQNERIDKSQRFTQIVQGRKFVDTRVFERVDGSIVKMWLSYDGQRGYQGEYWLDDPEQDKFRSMYRYQGLPPHGDECLDREWLAGAVLGVPGDSLVGILSSAESRIVDRDATIRDLTFQQAELARHCVKVEVEVAKPKNSSYLPYYVEIAFDPAQDWLPRSVVVHPVRFRNRDSSQPFTPQEGEVISGACVLEYQDVHDPLLGESRRMPRRLVDMTSQTVHELEDVQLGIDEPASAFRPVLTDGVRVVDDDKPVGKQTSYVGGNEGELAWGAHALRETQIIMAAEKAAAARASSALPHRLLWGAGSVLVAALAVWIFHRRRSAARAV